MGSARGAWAVRVVLAASLASAAGCPQQVPAGVTGSATSGTGAGGAASTTSASTSTAAGGGGSTATSSTTAAGSGGATSSSGSGGSPLDCSGPAPPAGQVEWTVSFPVAHDPQPGPATSPFSGSPAAVLVGATGHAFVEVTWGFVIFPNQFGGVVIEEIDPAGNALGDRAMTSLGAPESWPFDVAGATRFAAAIEGAVDEYDDGLLVSNSARISVSHDGDPPSPPNPFMPMPDAFVRMAATDAAGDTFGTFSAGPWMFPWGEDGGQLVVKLDAHGQHAWTKHLPSIYKGGITADEAGGAYVYGETDAQPAMSDPGCGPVPPSTAYLARIDASGACVFSEIVPRSTLVPTHRGDVYLTGAFQGTIDLGCGPIVSAPGATSSFIARMSPGGTCAWSRGVASATMGAWTSAGGGVLVAASYAGTIDLGAGPIASAGTQDTAIARYDGGGALVWSRSFGAAGATVSWTAGAADATGGAAVSLTATGAPVDFGGGPAGGGDGGAGDHVLVRLDASGAFRWQQAPFEGAFGIDPCGAVITASSCPSCMPANEYVVTATKLAP
jgi:hypothetical protein